jgi:hypothetical protein
LKVSNLNYGYEIVLYKIHQFRNRVPNHMVTILLSKKYIVGRNMFMPPCGFTYNVQSKWKNCKKLNTYNCVPLVICDLRGWLMVEFGFWGQGSWLSLSFGASIASLGMSVSLSSSSLLLHHSFASEVFIPHKVVMIFWLEHCHNSFVPQYPKCHHWCVVVHNNVHLQK